MNETETAGLLAPAPAREGAPPSAEEPKNPLLVALGERVRNLRAQRGLTRKAVAVAADVSERHLANLEYGTGNASILVLQQVAHALHCSLAELVGDFTTQSPEWLLIRELLEGNICRCTGYGPILAAGEMRGKNHTEATIFPEIVVRLRAIPGYVDRFAAASYGLSAADVSEAIQAGVGGAEARRPGSR